MSKKQNKMHKCDICFHHFPTKMALVRHNKHSHISDGILTFKCLLCDYETTRERNLLQHKEQHQMTDQLKCQKCDYIGVTATGYKRHLLTHSENMSLICNHCDYKSNSNYSMKTHMLKHTNEKPLKCKKCDFKTASKSVLSNHIKTHSEAKTFLCSYCDYIALRRYQLQRHLRKHTGVRPYKCMYCAFAASTSDGVQRHLAVHTGYKPFLCIQCGYNCSHVGNFRKHMRKHTGEKCFKCPLCKYESSVSFCIRRHLKTMHQNVLLKPVALKRKHSAKICDASVSSDGNMVDCDKDIESNMQEYEIILDEEKVQPLIFYENKHVTSRVQIRTKVKKTTSIVESINIENETDKSEPIKNKKNNWITSQPTEKFLDEESQFNSLKQIGDIKILEITNYGDCTANEEIVEMYIEPNDAELDQSGNYITQYNSKPEKKFMYEPTAPEQSTENGTEDTSENSTTFSVKEELGSVSYLDNGESECKSKCTAYPPSDNAHILESDPIAYAYDSVVSAEREIGSPPSSNDTLNTIKTKGNVTAEYETNSLHSEHNVIIKSTSTNAETTLNEQEIIAQSCDNISESNASNHTIESDETSVVTQLPDLQELTDNEINLVKEFIVSKLTSDPYVRVLNTGTVEWQPLDIAMNDPVKAHNQFELHSAIVEKGNSQDKNSDNLKDEQEESIPVREGNIEHLYNHSTVESWLGDDKDVVWRIYFPEFDENEKKLDLDIETLPKPIDETVHQPIFNLIEISNKDTVNSVEEFDASSFSQNSEGAKNNDQDEKLPVQVLDTSEQCFDNGTNETLVNKDGIDSSPITEIQITSMKMELQGVSEDSEIAELICDSDLEPLCGSSMDEDVDKTEITHKEIAIHSERLTDKATAYNCGKCEFKTTDVTELKSHCRSHGSNVPYFCRICGFVTRSSEYLQDHIAGHKEDGTDVKLEWLGDGSRKVRGAYNIEKLYPQAVALINTVDGVFHCKACMYTSKKVSAIIKHTRTHTADDDSSSWTPKTTPKNTQAHSCTICPFRTIHSEKLREHMTKHLDKNNKYICHLCDFSSSIPDLLKTHLATLHLVKKLILCSECAYTCKFANQMKRHMLLHSGERPFKCDECDFDTTTAVSLKNHVMTKHTNSEPLVCSYCSYRTVNIGNLRKHEMIHSGDKPWCCTECPYKVNNSTSLKRHMFLRHERDRNKVHKQCEFCKKTFLRDYNYEQHMSKGQCLAKVKKNIPWNETIVNIAKAKLTATEFPVFLIQNHVIDQNQINFII